MCPYAFGAGITAAQAYAACGSALGNRGYSSTVAGRVDTTISSRAKSGSSMRLSASGITNVKSALTSQGYTTTRAPYLDTINTKLNTTISSRAKSGSSMSINASGMTHIQTALTNQGYTTTRAPYIDRLNTKLDTTVSSRAVTGAAMSLNASGITHIGSALTTQGLTTTRATKLDKLDTTVSSRATIGAAMSLNASALTHIQTALTNQGLTSARAGYLDNIMKDLEDATGSLVMDGNEQTVKEFTTLTQRMDCYVDLSPVIAGDTVVLKQYMKIKSGGTYRLFGSESYSGVQASPATYVEVKPAKYGFKITLQQTAGTNRTIDWETFKQVKSG